MSSFIGDLAEWRREEEKGPRFNSHYGEIKRRFDSDLIKNTAATEIPLNSWDARIIIKRKWRKALVFAREKNEHAKIEYEQRKKNVHRLKRIR